MPPPSFDREAIEAEIGHVRSLGLDGLRALWRTTFRSPCRGQKELLSTFCRFECAGRLGSERRTDVLVRRV
jgi:hypothetical protein